MLKSLMIISVYRQTVGPNYLSNDLVIALGDRIYLNHGQNLLLQKCR